VTSGQDPQPHYLYLEVGDVLDLYAEVFRCSADQAGDQLRDLAGLEGALGRPAAHAHYDDADLAMQAAVLADGIAEGQYFVEGNKRAALAAMRTFLLVNGFEVTASQDQRARWMIGLSEGLTVASLAAELRRHTLAAGRLEE
jgi:death-on-curing protein